MRPAPLGNFELQFNPLGFLQFGPVVDLGPKVGSSTYLYGHFRWSSLGLVYRLVSTDGFEDDMSIGCMAIGVGFKHLFVRKYSLTVLMSLVFLNTVGVLHQET